MKPTSSAKADFFSRFSMQRLTFDQFRKENKLSMLSSLFLIFKSVIGVGFFIFPYAMGQTGYLYGTFLGILLTYMTTYGVYQLTSIASKVEKSKFGLKKMHSYHVLTEYLVDNSIGRKYKRFFSGLTIVCCFVVNADVIIGAILEGSIVLERYFDTGSTPLFKIIAIVIIMAVTLYTLEPERMKIVASVSAVSMFAVAVLQFSWNLKQVSPDHQKSDITIEAYRGNTGMFCAVGIMAFDGIGSIFTVRETMKERHQMPRTLAFAMVIIGYIFITFGLSFYFAYGNELLQTLSFKYFDEDEPLLNFTSVIFAFSLIIFVPLYNIANSEMLENFKVVSKWINNKNGDKNRVYLLFYRWILVLLVSFITFFGNHIEVYVNVVTMIFLPIIAFYLPIIYSFMHAKASKRPLGWLKTIHDCLFILVCAVAQVYGLYYTIKVQLIDGEDEEIIF